MKAALTAIVLLLAGQLTMDALQLRRERQAAGSPPPAAAASPASVTTRVIPVRDDRGYANTSSMSNGQYKILVILRDLGFTPPAVHTAYDEERHLLITRGNPAYVEALAKFMEQLDQPGKDLPQYVAHVRRLELVKGDGANPEIDARLKDVAGPLATLAREGGFSKIRLAEEVRDVGTPSQFVPHPDTKVKDGGIYSLEIDDDRAYVNAGKVGVQISYASPVTEDDAARILRTTGERPAAYETYRYQAVLPIGGGTGIVYCPEACETNNREVASQVFEGRPASACVITLEPLGPAKP